MRSRRALIELKVMIDKDRNGGACVSCLGGG